jgi:replicative DNA helicase
LAEKSTEMQLLATLMNNPKLLLQIDKYQIDINDFSEPRYRDIFWAIHSLAPQATGSLKPYEVEELLKKNPRTSMYLENGGKQILIDLESFNVSNFDITYMQFKRENLLEELQKAGLHKRYFVENANINTPEAEIDEAIVNETPQDILNNIEKGFTHLKSKYMLKDTSSVQTLANGMEELLDELQEKPEIGYSLQGDLFNYIVSGAMEKRFYLRSGASGIGKTRSCMADACYLAFPVRYDWSRRQWVNIGSSEKVLVVITEQDFDEVQKMALAYISGVNESTFKRNQTSIEQKKILRQALEIFNEYEKNFLVVRVPSPSISLIKQLIREQVIINDIHFVFYDYIFISPSLLNEFKGAALRNDEILLMFSDALKQLAVELNIFIMSSTQVNANADKSNEIRNEASLAGSRAVINKADMGCIAARPSKEELKTLESISAQLDCEPNVVTDIYKLRGGENTQVRIWSYMDLGTLRKKDLFVTNSRLEPIDIQYDGVTLGLTEEQEEKVLEILTRLNTK